MSDLRRRLIALAVFGVAAMTLPGCVPTTWLPDSSGFVYVKKIPGKMPFDPPSGGQLLHYDLQKKDSRVIVADIGASTTWPAVSPDGKRIAVSLFKGAAKQAKTVQVVIYDLQGKEVQKSKELAWMPAEQNNRGSADVDGMLFWSPKNDMLVVTDFNETGVYNVATQSLQVFPQAMPSIYGGTPIRPDGKGFLLVLQDKDKKGRLVFMDWTGKEQTIDTKDFVKAMPPAKGAGPGEDPIDTFPLLPLLLPSWWDGTSAGLGFKRNKVTCQIDTVKQLVSVSDAFVGMAKKKEENKGSEPAYFDFASDVSVEVLEIKEKNPADDKLKKNESGPNQPRPFSRVTIINHKTGKKDVVEPKGADMAMFSLSPDGNYVALTLSTLDFGPRDAKALPSQILIISSKGEVHSKIVLD